MRAACFSRPAVKPVVKPKQRSYPGGRVVEGRWWRNRLQRSPGPEEESGSMPCTIFTVVLESQS